MPPPRPMLLFVGCDRASLRAREEAFANVGFRVESATSADEAIALIHHGHHEVLVIGAAVGEGERDRITALFKSRNAAGRVVFLYDGSIRNAEAADALLSVLNPPDHLARAVCEQAGVPAAPGEACSDPERSKSGAE